jgi:hypothetical protein
MMLLLKALDTFRVVAEFAAVEATIVASLIDMIFVIIQAFFLLCFSLFYFSSLSNSYSELIISKTKQKKSINFQFQFSQSLLGERFLFFDKIILYKRILEEYAILISYIKLSSSDVLYVICL